MNTPETLIRRNHTAPYLGVVFDGDAEPLTEIPAETAPDARGRALNAWAEAQAAYDAAASHNRPADPPMWDLYRLDRITDDGTYVKAKSE